MKYLFLFLTIIVFILNCNTIEGQSNPSTKETSKITARSYYYDTKKKNGIMILFLIAVLTLQILKNQNLNKIIHYYRIVIRRIENI